MVGLIKVIAILMISAKLATLGLLKIKVFEIKIMTPQKNFIKLLKFTVDKVIETKFGNSNIPMNEAIITSIL